MIECSVFSTRGAMVLYITLCPRKKNECSFEDNFFELIFQLLWIYMRLPLEENYTSSCMNDFLSCKYIMLQTFSLITEFCNSCFREYLLKIWIPKGEKEYCIIQNAYFVISNFKLEVCKNSSPIWVVCCNYCRNIQ